MAAYPGAVSTMGRYHDTYYKVADRSGQVIVIRVNRDDIADLVATYGAADGLYECD